MPALRIMVCVEKRHRNLVVVFVLGGLATLCSKADTLPSDDMDFVTKIAQSGHAEVDTGKLAASKSSNAEIKKFAQRMSEEHSAIGLELRKIARAKGFPFPPEADQVHKEVVQQLEKEQGSKFDQTYASEAGVKDHATILALFEKEARTGKDSDLKAFAQEKLPVIKEHYEMAERLAGALKWN